MKRILYMLLGVALIYAAVFAILRLMGWPVWVILTTEAVGLFPPMVAWAYVRETTRMNEAGEHE